ncbi:hypothetical protein [Streptomyces sp. SID3343]|uniref:hypothetical protein n=1 Tax=Streptomyces sp. SID3343 TaxID=2690260 RepID=UPI00136EA013|nr:hypothetical protein [Streptomyces sp. SID3343]MYW03769.1 hypothetical protein [Streptomyces sp. SID3343]
MSSELDAEKFHRWILTVLDVLASPPDRQLDYLRTSHVDVDEIALQFDDAFNAARASLHADLMSRTDFERLRPVRERLDAIANDSHHLWEREALGEAAEWQEVRKAAAQARTELGNAWR